MNLQEFNQKYEQLTYIQKKVLWLFLENKRDREIANELVCSDANVRKHIQNICLAFGLRNEPGEHYRLRNDLKDLFVDYKPKLVSLILEEISPPQFLGDSVDINSLYRKPPLNKLDCPSESNSPNPNINIDTLIQEIREKIRLYIQQRCGKMQALDMTKPIGLGGIYTSVNILENITGRRRLSLTELQKIYKLNIEEFYRLGWGKTQQRISGLTTVENYPKLMVWGKPGAGKTTFLKYITIECIEGKFRSQQVPLFITLKEFAEITHQPDLPTYITQKLGECQVKETVTQQLLQQGKGLILLNGLDEVREEDSSRVIQQIQHLADHPQYSQNRIIVTCRIAAQEYTFQGFTEVEVANFNQAQIETFVNNWFEDPLKAERFIEKLENNKPIQELATNPLLLTLLCLVFEEIGNLPKSRTKLYKEGIDILLKKWDAQRNIERDQIYRNLSTKRKENLLSQIAWNTFKRGDYLFEQETVEGYIEDYIKNLPDAKTDPEALQLDDDEVLKSIEAQHGLLVARAKGIYSFSHLTFQEYFTAHKLGSRPSFEELQELVSHLTETRWREVFLLSVEMMEVEDAAKLVLSMKTKIDSLIAEDEQIQEFLKWLQEKASSVKVVYKPEDLKKFSETLGFAISNSRILHQIFYLSLSLFLDLYLSLYFDLQLYLDPHRHLDLYLDPQLHLSLFLDLHRHCIANIPDSSFENELQILEKQLPDSNSKDSFKQWKEKLRTLMVKYRDIGRDWQFNKEQEALLKQYYEANKLLMQCLDRDCFVDHQERNKIEETLFLPRG